MDEQKPKKERSELQKLQFEKARNRALELRAEKKAQKEVETPPALEAFPGANRIRALRKDVTASGVEGMFAPSATHMQPLATSI